MAKDARLSSLSYAVRPWVIARLLGSISIVLLVFNLAPLLLALALGEWDEALGYLFVVLVFAGLSLFSRLPQPRLVQHNEGLVVVALVFTLEPLLLSLPFSLAGLPWLDAWFEAVSAITTTGLSTLSDFPGMPATFLFARAWTQWYGALGTVVFTLALIIHHGGAAQRLMDPALEQEDLVGSVRSHAQRMLLVYLTFTGLALLILWPLMGGHDALHYALTAVATGGFAPYGHSLAGFDFPVQATVLLLALSCALPLPLYYRAWRRGPGELARHPEVRALLVLVLMAGALLTAVLVGRLGMPWQEALKHGMLTAVSAQSGTGFSTFDLTQLPPVALLVIIFAMFIGGGLASTAGGVKVLRLLILLRLIWLWVVRSALSQRAVLQPTLGGRLLDEEEIRSALVLFSLMVVTVVLSWLILLGFELPPLPALFEVVSALGTVGLSVGITGAELPPLPKLVLVLDMLLGRLELIALLVVLWSGTWFGHRRNGA